jgi:hypothetical protein
MRPGVRRAVVHLGLLSVVVLGLACAPGGWDGGGTEAELHASLLEAYPDTEISVRCPDPVDAGDTCAAVIGELELDLLLTSVGDGAAGYVFGADVVRTQDIARELATQLDADLGGSPQLRCEPGPLVVPRQGDELRCAATAGDRHHEVVAEFVDDEGAVRITAIHPDRPGGSE